MKKSLLLFLITLVQVEIIVSATTTLNKASWDGATRSRAELSRSSDITVKDIKANVGVAAAEAAEIIRQGVAEQNDNKSAIQNATYYNDKFLTMQWLTYFTTWFTSEGRTTPFSDMVQVSYKDPLKLSALEKNYVGIHLLTAIKIFQNSVTASVMNNNAYVVPQSSWGAQNYIVIHKIYNNTQTTFYIFQKDQQIGMLYPGVNAVALYGATLLDDGGAHNDIVFIPTQNLPDNGGYVQDFGQWRISFKKSLSGDSGDQDTQMYSLGGTSKAYICAEVSTQDIPKGGVATYQRAQGVDVSSLQNVAFVEFSVEDHLSDIVNNKKKEYDFETLKMFYPSIRCVKPLEYVTIPYLLTNQTVLDDIHDVGISKENRLTDMNVNVGFNSGSVMMSINQQNMSLLNGALQGNANVTMHVITYPYKGSYQVELEARVGSKVLFIQQNETFKPNASSVRTRNSLYCNTSNSSKSIDMGESDSVTLKAAMYKPVSVQSPKVVSWINFINIVLLCIQQNYANYADPEFIKNSVKNAQPVYIIQNSQKADITSPMSVKTSDDRLKCLDTNYNNSQIHVATSDFTSTTTLPTSDIPTVSRFGLAMKLYTRSKSENNRYLDMNSAQFTTSAMLNFIEETKFAELYMQYKILLPYNLQVKQDKSKGFIVIGSSGFAKSIVDELQKYPPIFLSVQKLLEVSLKDQNGDLQYFAMNDFLRNIGTQVATGVDVAYMTPIKTITTDDQNKEEAGRYGKYLFDTYQFGVEAVGTKGYSLTGTRGFAKAINKTFKQQPKALQLLNMLKNITLRDKEGKTFSFSINDFIKNIQSQALGKSIVYMKPIIKNQDALNAKQATTKEIQPIVKS